MQKEQKATFDLWIGIDWADKKHDVCLFDGESYESSILINDPPVLKAWAADLKAKYEGKTIAVAIESVTGGIGEFLKELPFINIFPINPLSFARYRSAFKVSNAKSDQLDAQLLCEYLHKNLEHCREEASAPAPVRKLKALSIARRKTVDSRTAITNEMKGLLKSYYPQALTLSGQDIYRPLACDFLEKWPTFQDIQKADDEELGIFYRKRNCKKRQVIESRIQLIRDSCPLSDDEALLSVSKLKIIALVRQLRALNETINEFNAAIEETLEDIPQSAILNTIPGIGNTMRARLTTAFSYGQDSYESAGDMQCKTGIAPVTVASGQMSVVHQRYACNKFERQTFIEFANLSIMHSVWARSFYNMKISQGKKHYVVIRALAFKWQRVLFACWKNGTPYSEQWYLNRLSQKQSPILKYVNTIDKNSNKWLRNLKDALV